ncbi:carbohydrate ABC transporter permease [Hoeflea ulvae]|uniref:Sugar ABC transporter permease n=1 Tax=Hoeflea ulvae TaxID=2983764 RepID=A0ABT3YLZ1_9HYPH|nr:sugar ABC transporter permease [Hoeflea ulvae]MCY0096858.1 sugar ABC transporter permease [Hoeflea ulvae]
MKNDVFWRYMTLMPAVVLFLALTIVPMINLFALSFHHIEWIERAAVWKSVGWSNYAAAFEDNLFRAGAVNTVIFAVVAVSIQMVLGFMLALLTTGVTRGRLFYRTVFLLPILVPGIIIGAIWKLMYSYDFGVINKTAIFLGMSPQDWLGNPHLALASVILVDVWHWTPFCFLLLLAALESLPQDIYEAARIDGSSPWQALRFITLPLMLPAIAVTFIFRMILALKVFDEVYLLTGGGPGTSTEVVSFTIYRRFFTEDRPGYGAAISIITFATVAILIFVAGRISRRRKVA